MTLFDQISEDIKSAMKARDKVRLETLRNIKKVFLEAKTAPGANDTLADADALKIISKLAKQSTEGIDILTVGNDLIETDTELVADGYHFQHEVPFRDSVNGADVGFQASPR